MTKLILIRQRNCIASTCASYWSENCGEEIDEVYIEDTPAIKELYGDIGVGKYPTLIKIGKYGVVSGIVKGFNERKYNELIGRGSNGRA